MKRKTKQRMETFEDFWQRNVETFCWMNSIAFKSLRRNVIEYALIQNISYLIVKFFEKIFDKKDEKNE